MARRNTLRPSSNAVAKAKSTSWSMRLQKEKGNRENKETIPCTGSKDEYTETPRPTSRFSSQLLVSLYPVAWVLCWCGIESATCLTHRRPNLRCTGLFQGYGWRTSPGLGLCYSNTSTLECSHRMFVNSYSNTTKADLTESSHETLVGLLPSSPLQDNPLSLAASGPVSS